MKLEDYISDLEEKIGTIVDVEECCPGGYRVEADNGERFHKEYYVLLDDAPFVGDIWNYGWWLRDVHVYEVGKYGSGWEVVEYEITKYNLAAGKSTVPEEVFHDRTIHAMDAYSEYFGDFPVPYHTPEGYTLRHYDLANGIYWLETSRGKELLALSFPIWNTELSAAAIALAKMTDQDRAAGVSKSLCYAFFSKEDSCVPFFELTLSRPAWAYARLSFPALMNALWKYAPEYAMYQNVGEIKEIEIPITNGCPEPSGKYVVGIFPCEGTDFLMLE